MRRLGQTWLALSFSATAVLPAHAQVTVEMTMITCEQYVLFAMGDPKDIAMWLSGYHSAKCNNTAFNVQEFREASKKVMDYCQLNLKTTVMDLLKRCWGSSGRWKLRGSVHGHWHSTGSDSSCDR